MNAEVLRRAAAEIREEWPEGRAMGQDRTGWRTWRAVADWLDQHAPDHGPSAGRNECPWTVCAALAVARAYLGESA